MTPGKNATLARLASATTVNRTRALLARRITALIAGSRVPTSAKAVTTATDLITVAIAPHAPMGARVVAQPVLETATQSQ